MTSSLSVAFPMRVDALDKPGGDVVLVQRYIRECTALAESKGIHFKGEILTSLSPDYSSYDVVHLTNIDRPVDTYSQYMAARHSQKRIVFTPIHHSYREIARYERSGRGGAVGAISGYLNFSQLELLRSLLKSYRYRELFAPACRLIAKGVVKAQREILLGSDVVLPAGEKEIAEIAYDFCHLPTQKVIILRNGSDPLPAVIETERDLDICVAGRIEARKNQIVILQALRLLGLKGVFVGGENPNHAEYCKQFKNMIDQSASTYVGQLSQPEVLALMRRSRVHVAASWFEVSSQVDIEAYGQGCRVVASQCGATNELLNGDAYYVDPASLPDIAGKIAAALQDSQNGVVNHLRPDADKMPTWRQLAETLLALYSSLIQTAVSSS